MIENGKVQLETDPATGERTPVLEQWPSGESPIGEEVAYIYDANNARARISPEELRERERMNSFSYSEVRVAAECHRQVRKHMQSIIKPGILMTDMCEQLENLNRRLVQENGLKARPAAVSPLGPPGLLGQWRVARPGGHRIPHGLLAQPRGCLG